MRRALFFTAYDRPEYLLQVLETWGYVRGLRKWDIVARIEPGAHTERIRQIFDGFRTGARHPNFEIIVNPERYGVLHHPWVGFEDLFSRRYDFVVRAEDDLRVSEDILEYFEWASQEFETDSRVATVHGFVDGGVDPSLVHLRQSFNPLVWGTWRSWWQELFSPTWDHDYSTHNGIPGVEAGWDWNINTRLYPQQQLLGVYPEASRVDNIGVHGTHSTPDNFYTAHFFERERPPQRFFQVSSSG